MICRFFVPPDPAHGRKLLTLRILAANENAPLAAVSRPQPRDNGANARRPSFERARIHELLQRHFDLSGLDVESREMLAWAVLILNRLPCSSRIHSPLPLQLMNSKFGGAKCGF